MESILSKEPMIENECIYVLSLGGTLLSTTDDLTSEFYNRPSKKIQELVETLPINLNIICEDYLAIISHEISLDKLLQIAKKIASLSNHPLIKGIVVVQGTNALEEVAYFVSLIAPTNKTIVFTGAFRPQNALGYDGARNLYNAIIIARSQNQWGVVTTFNDCIVSARNCCKINPSLTNSFSNNDGEIEGYITGNQLTITHRNHPQPTKFDIHQITSLPKILILYAHIGIESYLIEAAINNKVQGIISAGFGKGYQNKLITEALKNAVHNNVTVVRTSRTGQGIINHEDKLDEQCGFIAGGSLNPHKASIFLMAALCFTKDKNKLRTMFALA